MPSSGYTAITFVANEQPTTAKWNLIGSNDSSFNLGTGLEDSVIVNRHLATSAVSVDKMAAGSLELGFASGGASGVIPNAWTTYATVTATSKGGAVRAIGMFGINDGNSGAARYGQIRILCDGAVVTNTARTWKTNSSGDYITPSTMGETTPTAGSHTWVLQAFADTASASIVNGYGFSVQEVR